MLCVCNFADDGYAAQQRLNTKSAYKKGKADKVFEYHPSDLIELKAKYPDHFKIKKRLWTLVLETLFDFKSYGADG